MNGKIAPISNIRQVKDLHKTLEALRPGVLETVAAGCGVSPFFKGYIDRALKKRPERQSNADPSGF